LNQLLHSLPEWKEVYRDDTSWFTDELNFVLEGAATRALI
jgi:hypothetical protein